MVGLGRLERPTSPLSGVRSNHLSYRPVPVCDETGARERNTPRRCPERQWRGETKAAAFRQSGPDWSLVFQVIRSIQRPQEPQDPKRSSLERR